MKETLASFSSKAHGITDDGAGTPDYDARNRSAIVAYDGRTTASHDYDALHQHATVTACRNIATFFHLAASEGTCGECAYEELGLFADNPINRVDPTGMQAQPLVPDNSVLKIVPTTVVGTLRNGHDLVPPIWIRGDRGFVETSVKFVITKPNQNGWIIQHIVNTFNITGPNPTPAPPEYWEAWKVVDSKVFTVLPGDELVEHTADTFGFLNQPPRTKGTMEKIGYAAFIPNYDCRVPPWHEKSDIIGPMRNIEQLPGWSDQLAERHYLKVEWDDTVNPPKTTQIVSVDPMPPMPLLWGIAN